MKAPTSPSPVSPVSITLLGLLVLATVFFAFLKPTTARGRELDHVLTNLWHQILLTNQTYAVCAGLTPENVEQRRQALDHSKESIADVRILIERRTALPTNVMDRLAGTWQLHDFQSERQLRAEELMKLASQSGVAFEPGVTNGLPRYSAEIANPRLLWARLFLSEQVLQTAVAARVSRVHRLQQLPAAPGNRPYLELPFQIELTAKLDPLLRLLAALPLRGEELDRVGLPTTLTNKPAVFLRHILARKAAPNPPDLIRVELSICGFLPAPAAEPPPL